MASNIAAAGDEPATASPYRCASCGGEFANISDDDVIVPLSGAFLSGDAVVDPTEDYALICDDCAAAMTRMSDLNRKPARSRRSKATPGTPA
jgi:hypothetical protein